MMYDKVWLVVRGFGWSVGKICDMIMDPHDGVLMTSVGIVNTKADMAKM